VCAAKPAQSPNPWQGPRFLFAPRNAALFSAYYCFFLRVTTHSRNNDYACYDQWNMLMHRSEKLSSGFASLLGQVFTNLSLNLDPAAEFFLCKVRRLIEQSSSHFRIAHSEEMGAHAVLPTQNPLHLYLLLG